MGSHEYFQINHNYHPFLSHNQKQGIIVMSFNRRLRRSHWERYCSAMPNFAAIALITLLITKKYCRVMLYFCDSSYIYMIMISDKGV